MKYTRETYAKAKMRNEAFLAGIDEMINTFECVIGRVNRGEGLHSSSRLMSGC